MAYLIFLCHLDKNSREQETITNYLQKRMKYGRVKLRQTLKKQVPDTPRHHIKKAT
jgi:hypothetical protein